MRIAVSGTHSSGKSTLIDDFLAAHPDYTHEPEPYEWLDEAFGEPTADDFYRQLELCVERARSDDVNVIAERSALDFLAYLLALADLDRVGVDDSMIAAAVELAAVGMAPVDLLVVLPLETNDALTPPASEDLELREAMNERLLELITTDPYSLLRAETRVIEVTGSREQRLRALERAAVCIRMNVT